MITMQLQGRLGNQMFQYAMGRALALRRGTALTLDTNECGHSSLGCFRLPLIKAPLARIPEEVYLCRLHRYRYRRLRPYLWLHRQWSLIMRATGVYGPGPMLFRERALSFDPQMRDLPDGSYVAGYWQSERYFAEAADTIRSDFVLREPPSPDNRCWLDFIRAQDCAVSVHVRRDDYLLSDLHGVCSPAYYREAARLVEQRTGAKSVFFVFSDEPDWAREHLRLGHETYVLDHNDTKDRPHEDLRLMAACDHHVIANSSFSWWGAWLDSSPDKIVVGPEPWLRSREHEPTGILPEGWLRVPSGVRDPAP